MPGAGAREASALEGGNGPESVARLFRILHNEYVSQIRRAARQGTAVDWSEYEPTLTCAPGQIEHLEIRDLLRALTSLPEEQRTAVLMIGLAKGDYYEVASACKVPVGTIRSRLSRGRKTLRALMSVAPLEPHIANRCARTAKDWFCQHLRQVADTSRRGVRSCSL